MGPLLLALLAAGVLVGGWLSGRFLSVSRTLAGSALLLLPAWFFWMVSENVLSGTPLPDRFSQGLRERDAATWAFAAVLLVLLAAVLWTLVRED